MHSSQSDSLRGLERRYGASRFLLADEVRAGRLPGERIGRSIVVQEDDFQPWLRRWLQNLLTQIEAPQ